MTKKILIDGMSCSHCSASVEAALGAIDGVTASVDLAAKTATVTLTGDVSDAVLKAAIEDIGFDVLSID